jgi:hypothetical protein
MFQRFAAGTTVASIVIAIAAVILSVISGLEFERIYPVTIFWCCVPLIWGVWAMLTPRVWMPKQLPLWGAFLGLFAGLMAVLVLNLPSRFLERPVSMLVRIIAVLAGTLLYYLMWMLVRGAWRWLAGRTSA